MKTTLPILIGALLLSNLACLAQPPLAEWTNHFSLTFSVDCCESAIETADDCFALAGFTRMIGTDDFDMVLLKMDRSGHRIWSNTYGVNLADICKDVIQTDDGGYILCGLTETDEVYSADICLVKTDEFGYAQSTLTYGGGDSDYGASIAKTTDGGYIVGGSTWSWGAGLCDVYLFKIDSNFNLQWQSVFGIGGGDVGRECGQTSDGGYFIAGHSDRSGVGLEDFAAYLVKTDDTGSLEWERTYEGQGYVECYSGIHTSDGGFILTGATCPVQFDPTDVYVVKTDNLGNVEWEQYYGGDLDEYGYAIIETADGGYMITGTTSEHTPDYGNMFIYKIDGTGNMEWENTYGGYLNDSGLDLIQTQSGEYLIAGKTLGLNPMFTDFYTVLIGSEPEPDIQLTLTPRNYPIIILASGGQISYEIELTNNDPEPQQLEVWIAVDTPGGIGAFPMGEPKSVTINSGETISRLLTHNVPGDYPSGEYIFYMHAGIYFDDSWAVDSFDFSKSETSEAGSNSGDKIADASTVKCTVSPNPFNNHTKFTIELGKNGETSLKIFDINGRVVEELISGWYPAGTYEIDFNGMLYSSGVYFYNLQAGGQKSGGKMVLTK